MTLQRQLLVWAAVLALSIFVLWFLSPILLPFIAGMVLAYILDPVADALERTGLRRLFATIVILSLSVLVLTLLGILLLPLLGDQIAKLAQNLPEAIAFVLDRAEDLVPSWLKEMVTRTDSEVQAKATEFAGSAAAWLATMLGSVWSGGLALVNLISLVVITPVVAFYLLNDWDRMVSRIDSWLPREHVLTIRRLFSEIDVAMAGFVRGQGTVCLILGLIYAVGLSAVGLNFGLLIGLGAGLISFIPFVGSIVGGVAAIGVALVQFWPDWLWVLVVAAIFAGGQFIEGNFLSPWLVGDRVGLHPVWLMFALLAFGYLFGFVGLLMAVPLAAAVGVLTRFGLEQYLASGLYRGTGDTQPEPPPLDLKRWRGRK